MPNLSKELLKCKHPNSRKTKALAKKAKIFNNKRKSRLGHAIKSNILGEKLSWFCQHIEDRESVLSPKEFQDLIELYLKRFDEELDQIHLKQGISKKRTHQHVARENVIKFTLEREKGEYYGGGIELLNLCNQSQFNALKEWDGSAINVQHLKLDLVSKNLLEKLQAPNQSQIVHTKPKIIITASSDGEQIEEPME